MKIENIKAFSLAEALITLLIVCLITLASVPVLTKKHRSKNKAETQSHGTYTCFLDGAGVYHFQSEINGIKNEGVLDTDFCKFTPPSDGRDYTVVAIGGGAGGGAGYSFTDTKMFTSSSIYTVPEDGIYDFVIIGGGGGGYPRRVSLNNRGESGGYLSGITELNKGDSIIVSVGQAGYQSESVSGNIVAGDSSILTPEKVYVATAGQGCKLVNYNNEDGSGSCGYSNGQMGLPNGTRGFDASLENIYACPVYSNSEPYKSMIPSNMLPKPGCGGGCRWDTYRGKGSENDKALDKLDGRASGGFVAIGSTTKYCGEGGSAGDVVSVGFKDINDDVEIKLGKGGKGAVDKSTNAQNGQSSKFGNFVIAKGGIAGRSSSSCDVNGDGKIIGHNGLPSFLVTNALTFGACGGGRTCQMADKTNKSVNFENLSLNGMNAESFGSGGGGGAIDGSGGNGAVGIVYIKW